MIYLSILPFSITAWLLGVSHSRNRSFSKYGFFALLILPILIDVQMLVIFITAFFILGFLYDQEGSAYALYLRLKAAFSKKAAPRVARPSVKRRKKRFEYKQKRGYSTYAENEPKSDQEQPDYTKAQDEESHRDKVRRQREEEIRQQREGG